MRSIQSRFNKIQETAPLLGDYPSLMRAVRGQNFSRKIISQWFDKLISKDDFCPKERNRLVSQLYQASNHAEDGRFQAKNQFSAALILDDEYSLMRD